MMAGACGAGPKGEQFRGKWFVNAAGEHLFMESGEDGMEQRQGHRGMRGLGVQAEAGGPLSPMRAAFEKMSRRKSWF